MAIDAGWPQAGKNLQHYIEGSGEKLTIDDSFFTKYKHTQVDLEYNINRFFNYESETATYKNIGDLASQLKDGETGSYSDYYNTTIRTEGRDAIFFWDDNPSIDQPAQSTEASYAIGNFTVTSTANISVEKKEEKFLISGSVLNVFTDKYNWDGAKGFNVTIFGITIEDAELTEVGAKSSKDCDLAAFTFCGYKPLFMVKNLAVFKLINSHLLAIY